jgi:hypothetical protein
MSDHEQHYFRQVLRIVLLAAVYYAAAKLGFTLTDAAKQVTAVWPPTGIALAAILLFGRGVWPGIMLGAFLANATADEPLVTALGISIGNTLEALVGAWLLQRYAGQGSYLNTDALTNNHWTSNLALIFDRATKETVANLGWRPRSKRAPWGFKQELKSDKNGDIINIVKYLTQAAVAQNLVV